VFATPMMITAMENPALNAIRGFLEPRKARSARGEYPHSARRRRHVVTAEAKSPREWPAHTFKVTGATRRRNWQPTHETRGDRPGKTAARLKAKSR